MGFYDIVCLLDSDHKSGVTPIIVADIDEPHSRVSWSSAGKDEHLLLKRGRKGFRNRYPISLRPSY